MGTVAAEDKYSGAVDVGLAPSRWLPLLVGGVVTATLVILGFARLPLAATILLATGSACVGLDALRRARIGHVLSISRDGGLSIDGRAGLLREGSFVAPWLTLVRWRPAGARFDRTLLVLPDMVGREEFRRLRVLLRWG